MSATRGEKFIARKPFAAAAPKIIGPRINEEISVPQILLIDHHGEKRGVVKLEDALALAADAGLDVVEVSPNTQPPVCKIMDYGEYKYQQQKKKAEELRKAKEAKDAEEKAKTEAIIADLEQNKE